MGGSFINDFEPWGINNNDDLAFAADLSTGGADAVFLLPRGQLSALPLARIGQPAPGGGTFEAGVLGHAAINNTGDVAFVYGLNPFNPPELKGFAKAGLYRYSRANRELNAVVIPGVTPAPGFGVFQSSGQHASMNNSGEIVFPGVVRTIAGRSPDFGQGIFLADRNGQISKVVAPGDPAPRGHVFDFTINPWINDGGDVAFGGHVNGEECIRISQFGPACAESIYVKSKATGNLQSIAHQGDPASGGGHYLWAWGPVLNNRGEIVFMGELAPQFGVQTARGIFLYSESATIAIARPGDTMPNGRKLITVNQHGGVGNYSLDNRGVVGFIASLDGGESGLYVYSRRSLQLVAGTGTAIPGVGAIASVKDYVNGATLNDNGQVLFWATLTDGRGVLLLATLPPVAFNTRP